MQFDCNPRFPIRSLYKGVNRYEFIQHQSTIFTTPPARLQTRICNKEPMYKGNRPWFYYLRNPISILFCVIHRNLQQSHIVRHILQGCKQGFQIKNLYIQALTPSSTNSTLDPTERGRKCLKRTRQL